MMNFWLEDHKAKISESLGPSNYTQKTSLYANVALSKLLLPSLISMLVVVVDVDVDVDADS